MIAFKDTIFAYALYYPAVEILSSIAIALIVWRGGFGVIRNSGTGASLVTIGVLSAFIQYSQRFFRPIMDLEREVQYSAGGDGGLREDIQAAGYAGGDCFAAWRRRLGMARTGSSSGMCGLRTRR